MGIVIKLCEGMVGSEGRIQLKNSDTWYKLVSFSYTSQVDINMVLEHNGNNILVTRRRQEFKCIGCSRQRL